jgi:hypothetical protein
MKNTITNETKLGRNIMKAGKIFSRNKRVFCAFESKCDFKKTVPEKKSSQPKNGYAICTWKGPCNQQADNLKQDAKALLAFFYAA